MSRSLEESVEAERITDSDEIAEFRRRFRETWGYDPPEPARPDEQAEDRRSA